MTREISKNHNPKEHFTTLESVLIKALQLIVSISLLVVLHEGGHFFFAKLFKTRVRKFYLFFDFPLIFDKPKFALFKWPRHKTSEDQTEYGIGWLPFGGYVDIEGMIDESKSAKDLASEPQPWEFRSKPAWQRLLIMLGGILMNILVAFAIYAMVLFVWGESYVKSSDMTYGMKFNSAAKADGFQDGDIIVKTDGEEVEAWNATCLRDISNSKVVTVKRGGEMVDIPMPEKMNLLDMLQSDPIYATPLIPMQVDSVLEGTPAAKIGLKKGDKITAVNGTQIADFNDFKYQLLLLSDALTENSTKADSIRQRTVSLVINGKDTVSTVLNADFSIGYMNISPADFYKITTKEYGFFESMPAGVKYAWETLAGYVNDMKYVFTKQGARSVGGFIGIANIFPDMWNWQKFWLLTAFLSIALAFMNVLPIPGLDGGHALFTLFEMVTGRKPSEKFLERTQMVGLFLIFALVIFANLNDILRLFGI